MNTVSTNDNNVLEVRELFLSFGGVQALLDVNATVKEREILAIIGPNGAGKTALLNCISGFYRPQKGSIWYKGVNLCKRRSHKIAKMGIARTFQNSALYDGLSTVDNLMSARHTSIKNNFITGALYFGPALKEEVEQRKIVEKIIDFLEMEPIRKSIVGSLPYGLRKRVDLGRALALEAEILLLDEPMAGMNLEEKEDMARFIIDIFETRHIPIVLVEHDMEVVMDISHRVIVLDSGQKIAEGDPPAISNNPQVIAAYLGSKSDGFSRTIMGES